MDTQCVVLLFFILACGCHGGIEECQDEGDLYKEACNTCVCLENQSSGWLVACTRMTCPQCTLGDTTYNDGDTFVSPDGCNNCTCSNSLILCTQMACLFNDRDHAVCNYNGVEYSAGDKWTCADGCNTCVCSENGMVAQTRKLCPSLRGSAFCTTSGGDKYVLGQIFQSEDGCNMCTCMDGGATSCSTQECDPSAAPTLMFSGLILLVSLSVAGLLEE